MIRESIICEKLAAGDFDFTVHAVFEAAADLDFVDEVERVLPLGAIIENDVGRARCVVLCPLSTTEQLHVVLEYFDWIADPDSHLVLVTVYRPDPRRWIDGRTRRT